MLLAACGGDALTGPDRDATRQVGGNDRSLADILPEPYLTDVGCSVQSGPRDTSTVAVKRFGGGFARFACADVPRDSVSAAIGRYREAGASALGGASAQSGDPGGGDGGLVYLYTTYSCDLTHIWEWDPFVGLYVYLWTTGECIFREFYWDPSVGGPAPPPPAGADTTSTPPNSVPLDTCPDANDDHHVMFSAAMQDSLTKALQESIASNTELHGAFVVINGKPAFIRGIADPDSTDNCNWKGTTPVAGLVVLGLWHTHPDADNTPVTCRLTGPMTPNNQINGGGSDKDWEVATSQGKPMYTRGPGYVYRLDPNVPVLDRPNNPNHWVVGAGRCATRVQA